MIATGNKMRSICPLRSLFQSLVGSVVDCDRNNLTETGAEITRLFQSLVGSVVDCDLRRLGGFESLLDRAVSIPSRECS